MSIPASFDAREKAGTPICRTENSAMKFFYAHVLRRSFRWEELPYPKNKKPLPIILSQDEVRRIIDAASDLFQRAILMTLYSTGIRCEEVAHLTIGDIDNKRMMVRIHRGKGGMDRGG
jgi:integrase/recombinase XerD